MPKRPQLRTAALALTAPLAVAADADAKIDGGPPVSTTTPDAAPGKKPGKAKDLQPAARQAAPVNSSPYGDDHRTPLRPTTPQRKADPIHAEPAVAVPTTPKRPARSFGDEHRTPVRDTQRRADPVRAEPAVASRTPSPVVRPSRTPADTYRPTPAASHGDDRGSAARAPAASSGDDHRATTRGPAASSGDDHRATTRGPASSSDDDHRATTSRPAASYGDDHRTPLRDTGSTPERQADPVRSEPAVNAGTPSPVVNPTPTPADTYRPKPKPKPNGDPIGEEPAVSSYVPSGSYGDEHRSPLREPPPDTISVYDGPTQGPAIGREAPPSLPYPYPKGANRKVTIGVDCSAAPKAGGGVARGCLGKGEKPGRAPIGNTGADGSFEVKTEVKGSVGRGDDVLTEQGQRTKLSLAIENRVVASAEARKGPYKASFDYYRGRGTTYDIGVSTDRADRIQRGEDAPSPNDPRTLREGDSLLLSKSYFGGGDGTVGYGPLEAGYGRRSGATKSAGVEKGRNGTVKITVGDDDFVERTVTAGVGNEDVGASITGGHKTTDGEATTVRLDTSTPSGWKAYQQFVTTGRIPYDDRLPTQHIDRDSESYETSAGIRVGPIGWAGTHEGESTENRTTTNRHGRTTYESSRHLERLTTTRREHGSERGAAKPPSTTFLFDDVSTPVYRELVKHLPAGTNGQAVDGDNTDVKLDLTDADLNRLREQAIDRLGQGYEEWGGKTLSRQQVLDMMDEQGTVVAQMGTEENLVRAKTPAEIAEAVYRKGVNGDADSVLKFFAESALADGALNGESGEGAGTPTVIDD